MDMENNGQLLPKDDALVEEIEIPAMKPLRVRSSSRLVVSTAQREILGSPLHRTELPVTLLGFFYGDGVLDEEEEYIRDDDEYLPYKNYGRFARLLPGTTTPVDVDLSLSFLSKALPGRHIYLIDSCNGLLLLGHMPESYYWPDFAVCNPATQQWVDVPSCVDWVDDDLRNDPRDFTSQTHISLLFDPAVSSHFQVLLFWNFHLLDDKLGTTTVHAYSSETGVWRNNESDWSPEERQAPLEKWRRQISPDRFILQTTPGGAFVDGMLYLNLAWCQRILQVDMEGKTRGMFSAPAMNKKRGASNRLLFVGRSQGRLHCVVEEGREHLPGRRLSSRYRKKWTSSGLFLWVLKDMDRQKWFRKHKKEVTREQLFGKMISKGDGLYDFRVVAMHPDRDIVFFQLRRKPNRPLVSYDFGRKELCAVDTYEHQESDKIIPFVPAYSSELFLGVFGAHK